MLNRAEMTHVRAGLARNIKNVTELESDQVGRWRSFRMALLMIFQ